MRPKLKNFSDFVNGLLPHETAYLLSQQQFVDEVKLSLLQQVHHSSHQVSGPPDFDPAIDKRKYSHLKNWIQKRLEAIDVDTHFAWMTELERKIRWDLISPAEEKGLLKAIRRYEHPHFNFIKFYELARQFRQFLLIRLRYADHQEIDDFLRTYAHAYEHAVLVQEQLHRATTDIIQQYANQARESIQWEQWLSDMFYDDNLDGFNRYSALVRLVFIAFNYHKYEQILPMFDYLDEAFSRGESYSKRILLNYYSNRMLLHTRLGEWEEAIHYGYLSIRGNNQDHLLYVNNLCNVLLQRDQVDQAWNILKQTLPIVKTTQNYHSRFGFVALYMNALNRRGESEMARSYGELNLEAYEKEILRYRWYRFFVSYLQSLLLCGKFGQVLGLIRKYKLVAKERQSRRHRQSLHFLAWYQLFAAYQLGQFDFEQLAQDLQQMLPSDPTRTNAYALLMQRLEVRFPELNKQLTETLNLI